MTLFIKYDGKEFTNLYSIKTPDELGDAFDGCRTVHEDSATVLQAFFGTDQASRIWQSAVIIAYVFIDPWMEKAGNVRALRISTTPSKEDCIDMYNKSLERVPKPVEKKEDIHDNPYVKAAIEKAKKEAANG